MPTDPEAPPHSSARVYAVFAAAFAVPVAAALILWVLKGRRPAPAAPPAAAPAFASRADGEAEPP
ncbi:MAG: hypothetical protein KGM24_10480, partial [Elusimicrobia bacterium]|nr:hypothetical protein [Elusimicrobiota bacterium]